MSLVGQRDDAQKAAQESKEDASRYSKERDCARVERARLKAQVEKFTSDLEDALMEVTRVQQQDRRDTRELAMLRAGAAYEIPQGKIKLEYEPS